MDFFSKFPEFANSMPQLIATVVLVLVFFVHCFQLLYKFHLLYKPVGVRDYSGLGEEHFGVLSRNDYSDRSGLTLLERIISLFSSSRIGKSVLNCFLNVSTPALSSAIAIAITFTSARPVSAWIVL